MENCICPECVSACRNDPGRLVPDDVRKLSRLLGISERDLENDYLVRVSVASGGHTVHALAPAKRKGRRFVAAPGAAAPDYYAKEEGGAYFLTTTTVVQCMRRSPSSAQRTWDAATLF